MLTLTRSASRIPRARRPQGQRGFARAWLVVAWAMFFVNTALFPCCEAVAAVLGGHANTNNGTQTASVAPPPHHSGDTHTDAPVHDPYAPCEHAFSAGPVLVEALGVATSDRSLLHWLAVEESFSLCPTVVVHRPSLNLPQAAPPPQPRFHLRTQRLLI